MLAGAQRDDDYGSVACRLVCGKLPVFLGDISFCIYVVHLPCIRITRLIGSHLGISLNPLIEAVLIIAITIAVAYVVNKLFEKPITRYLTLKFGSSIR